ncbi:hypothetical protein ES708_17165 [subsurface metagenome]
MKKTKGVVVSKTVIVPSILITSLFAFWGFANDITNLLWRELNGILNA